MAFTPLTDEQIAAGEANKQELWKTVQEDLDDLNSRLSTAEGVQQIPMHFHATGPLDIFDLETALDVQRLNFDVTILAGRLLTHTAGSAGSNEIDILFKRGAGVWTSIFSTNPATAFGDGDFALNTGVLSVTSLLAGDLIRMDITSVQTDGRSLVGILEFEGA